MKQIGLTNITESLTIGEDDWMAVQQLARNYGWEGDTLDRGAIGPGNSHSLHEALTNALPDIPRHDALSHKVSGSYPEECRFTDSVNLFEWFSGNHGRDIIKRVIRLCRSGSVFISQQEC